MRRASILLLMGVMCSMSCATVFKLERLEGLIALRVVNSKSIEIFRDRGTLIGLHGPGRESLSLGNSFVLKDADHIFLQYRLLEIKRRHVVLEEADKSHLPLEEEP